MMNHRTALFGGEQRKWWILLAVLLLVLIGVQQVGANLDWTLETNSAGFGNMTNGMASLISNGDIWITAMEANPTPGLFNTTDGVTWSVLCSGEPLWESPAAVILEYDDAFWAFEYNDVKNSTDDGVTWNVVTYNTGYANRHSFHGWVKDGYMWIGGGSYGGSDLYDLWKSTNGTTWEEVNSNVGFSFVGGSFGVFDDKLWYIDGTASYSSSDGVTWYTSTSPGANVSHNKIWEYDGQMYVFGWEGSIWRSSDGDSWEQIETTYEPEWLDDYKYWYEYEPGVGEYLYRQEFVPYILGDDLYIAGGEYYDPLAGEGGDWVSLAEVWSAPIPSNSPPPDPGEDDKTLYWKLVKDGFTYSASITGQLFEHNGVLFLMTSPNGILYENPSGNPYSAWYTVYSASNPPQPYLPSGLSFPRVMEHNNTVWVLGGNPRYNYTWQSSEYINWANPGLTTWSLRCTTSWNPSGQIGGAFVSFNDELYRIGSNDETQVYKTITGDSWELVTSSLPFTAASVYANETYIYALTSNVSGNNSLYRSSNGASWTRLTENATQYKYQPDNGFKNIVEWDNKLWVVGGGSEATYYSRNDGYNWHLDIEYCEEYPEIDHTSVAIVYDSPGTIPEMIYSYSMWTGELWAGAYFPVANFTGTPLSGSYPLTVVFTDTSVNEPTSWLWSFGDGQTSTSQNPSHTYTYPGIFTISLTATNIYGSDAETKANYVTVGDISGVAINGHVYDAYNDITISSANISFLQYATYHNTTSGLDGSYSFGSVFAKDESINTNTSKSGYIPFPTNFMVLANGTYEYDLYMIPELNDDVGGTDAWIGGFVYDEVWAQGVPNATVKIGNATWGDTNVTNDAGFYLFTNLTNSSYILNATAITFDDSIDFNVTADLGNFTQQDIPLSPNYDLDLIFKDSTTFGIIYGNVSYVLSNATNGSILFQNSTTTGAFSTGLIDYGLYNFTAGCEGYYPYAAEIYLYTNVSSDVFLDPITEFDGANTNYVPHPVRFTYVDATGNPITGATVTATALESTNPWSWLEGVFGFSSTVDISGTVLKGTTGSDGTLSFLMVETVQYRVNCVKASAGIDHTVDIYPKESEYFIRIGALPSVGSGYPTYSVNATTSGTNVILFGNYSDTSGQTNSVRFLVLNSTGGEIYNSTMTLTGGVGSASFSVNNTKGTQLKVGIVADHSTEGTIEKWIDVTLKGPTGRLIDFGEGWTDFMYIVMSLACIFLVAGCFGEMDVKSGMIIVPVVVAPIFAFIGWLPAEYTAFIVLAGCLGGLYYMRSKAGELDK